MGRNIPSISARLDAKIAQWDRFARLLHGKDKEAFQQLISAIKDKRTAIDAADEADIGVAILLAAAVNMMGRLSERTGGEAGKDQNRL